MGRMLEALKHTDTAPLPPESALRPEADLADSEPAEDTMPFIEVGGPRGAGVPKPFLELPRPRLATLRVQPAPNVRLQPLARPSPRVAAELIAFHQPEHAVSQQYNALFLQMAPEVTTDLASALLLTALAPGAGTTTALLNLAISGCRHHRRRIVVVDANRARPAVALRLGIEAAAGLHDVLQGRLALEQAVLATPQSELQVLPAGASAPHSAAWPADALRWVLAWLRQRFDLVLVDGPAWGKGEGESNELRTLSALADEVYLVMDATEAQQPLVRAVTREVMQRGSRVGGLIVTQ
jgi:Mrp family chromosome partitioning ATPase